MDLYNDAIRNLPDAEKLMLVQQIWDDLSGSDSIPLPDWAITEAKRRRDEMLADPKFGKTHTEVAERIREWRDG
jgi:putative addiction module component (TIGR02574 family)